MSGLKGFLTNEERMTAMRIGFAEKLASYGLKPSDLDAGLEKKADSGDKANLLDSVLKAAVMTGIPLGAMLFMFNNSTYGKTKEELALEKERDYYKMLSEEEKRRIPVQKKQTRSYFG